MHADDHLEHAAAFDYLRDAVHLLERLPIRLLRVFQGKAKSRLAVPHCTDIFGSSDLLHYGCGQTLVFLTHDLLPPRLFYKLHL